MKSKVAERMLAKMPEETKIYMDWYAGIAVRIHAILKEKGLNQKELADKMGKQPSEIHKWLNGEHNFTLKSLARLQAELGEPLLSIPQMQKHSHFEKHSHVVTYRVTVNRTRIDETRNIEWKSVLHIEQKVAGVG